MKQRFDIDEGERQVCFDLRGYTVGEAEEVADQKVREAWENGFQQITLIHGCSYVRHHLQAATLGQGGVKWALRGRLTQGVWSEFVFPRRSAKHDVNGWCMTLALRPNRSPRSPARWEPLPVGYYEELREEALAG